jgi:protein N-terminal methyltransferase
MKQALMDYGVHKCGKSTLEVELDVQDRTVNIAPYGFDHNYVVTPSRDATALKFVAALQYHNAQRLSICSTAPGVQLYTGNFLDGTVAAHRWQGLCLETQHFPDSILVDPDRHPEFYKGKCPILTPESPTYLQDLEYTIEWANPTSQPIVKESTTDNFYGTAVVGDEEYDSVAEMWKHQGVDTTDDHDSSTEWYRRGATYYNERCPPTIDGVLGGFASISDVDLEGSWEFIRQLVQVRPEARTWLVALEESRCCRACECGAGLGRVVKGLLLSSWLPGITHCDLVEPAESLLLAAPEYLTDPIASKCRFFKSALQDWEPIPNTYSLIWVQWVLMYLTDRDVIAFLQRCGKALIPGGFIVVKENICDTCDIELDPEDASVNRSPRYWQHLIQSAGLSIVYEYRQPGLPAELHPVVMLALELSCEF